MMRARQKAVEPLIAAGNAPRRRRRKPGAWRAAFYALLVHLVLLALLLIGLQWSRRPESPPIQAYVADSAHVPARPVAPEPPVEAKHEEQERSARETKRAADVKQQEEEKRQAEAKRRAADEEKKRLEAKRRAEEDRKRAEQKRRAEEEKKQAEVKRKEEEAKRRKEAERSLKENLAAEEQAREEAARSARMRTQLEQFTELVRQRVSRNWGRPPGTAKGLKCTVRVRVAPGGEVLGAAVVRSSGNVAFDRSVESAVYKAVPLPVPQERELFEYFREIEFVFNPEE
jgi:colicin import membrane protein